ncbi:MULTISPECIES: LysR substrate-binding domain-containing protein [unclassified Aminobacter]|uniref:LysR substrate-binding domain-containing protein n=1 Tax=unclassified Aminobacter TaxID=2644704 RepID=UPI000463D415|nr:MULTISPECIES: LysR substrate-binding domain-containing protein [unclassified Aminobacter]TWH35795.1 DNA-binding transcriptional LysR family regulator [Aminobacter sp. J15]
MNLSYFAAFRAVMLAGTVSGAAQILGRSQPAVSRLLDKLEYELGVQLFERRKGLVTPTAHAYALLKEIERAYVSLDSLRISALRLAKGEASEINIATMPALGLDFIPFVLSQFYSDWPNIKVTLSVRTSTRVEEYAAAQQIDFGFAEISYQRSGFRVEMFSTAPYVVAVPANHPYAGRSSLSMEDLSGTSFISYSSFAPGRHLFDQASQSSGVETDHIYETNLSAPAYAMVKHGLGTAIIDPFTAVLQRCEQVRVVPLVPAIPFRVSLLRPETRATNPAIEALLEKMRELREKVLSELPV